LSISSTQGPVAYSINALPQVLTVTFPFNLPSDLGVSDGAVKLSLGGDYTVTGGGYNSANQLQTGSITVISGGSGNVQAGDVVTIYRNILPVQLTSFLSTGLLTPLMIESDDDKLTTLIQQLQQAFYSPFPPSGGIFGSSMGPVIISGTTNINMLGWITAQTGGIKTSIDSLNVVNIPTLALPLSIAVTIGGFMSIWNLRPMQVGDPSASVAYSFVVPITNPTQLIWALVK
jgi:hypothetical protein